MKPTRVLLAAASSLFVSQLMAGEAVLYITEDGSAVRDLAVSVDGQKKLVGASGFVVFDIKKGDHKVELSKYGEWLGEFDFATAGSNQNAEVQVELVGGEPMPEINIYTPGQEEAPAVGQISGYLQSDETGGPVSGARISVAGTEMAMMTDADGFFSFELPRGEYALNIAHPNYGKRDVSSVRVMSNVNTGVNMTMSMSGDGMIEEVVAVGSYIPSTATAQERDSSAVLNAIGAEQMSRFGDSNVASALKRVAGVSVQGGQFAIVRGLKGRYVSSTLNGLLMPSTDPLRRDVPLDLFPASMLEGVEIQKSYTPDLPGDTTGASIRMITKDTPDGFVSKLSVGGSINTQVTGQDVLSYDGGSSDFLGMDDGTREMPGSVDSATNGGQTGALSDVCASGCEFTLSDVASYVGEFENTYNTKETSALPGGSFSLAYGDLIEKGDNNYGYYASVAYSSDWSSREDAKIDDGSGKFDYERSKYKVDLSAYLALSMESAEGHTLTSKTMFLRKSDDTTRFEDGTNREGSSQQEVTLQWVERQFLSQQFTGEHIFGDSHELDWRIGISQTSRYEPDRRSYRSLNGAPIITSIERRFMDLTENSVDFGADYTFETAFSDSILFKGKTGFLMSEKDRDVELARFGINPNSSVSVDPSSDLEELLSGNNLDNNAFLLRVNTDDTDFYEATDTMQAFYGSAEFNLSDEYIVLVGARLEDSEQELKYPDRERSNASLDTSETLPVANLTWLATEDMQFRASYSKTIARPGLTELSSSLVYDPDTDEQLFGNPDLEISTIDNIDFRAEYYFSDEENISLALFLKDITKPIEKTIPDASGSASDGFTYENSDSAELSGIEIDFRKNIVDGDGWTSFVSGNIAWVDSEVTLSEDAKRLEQRSSRELQGQSEYLANFQMGWDHLTTGQSFTILMNYFDDRIDKVTRGNDLELEKGRETVDFVYSWDVSDDMVFAAKAKNLTNRPVEYVQGSKVIESYKEGIDISASVTWNF